MTDYLAGVQRLTGNTLDYYHPRNCFLPWVIEFRCGLPITLTLIYILVGKRIGLDIEGISAPGHFLARMDGVIFDPYHAGRIVSQPEWGRICNEVPLSNKALVEAACTPINLIHRLLINLRNSHVKRDDANGRKRIDSYLAVLQR
jgi:regulator of sirC expression with transglutaminase-like and TPR domain